MPLSIQVPQKQKESTLDKVLKGVQIAQNLFNIPVDYEKLKSYQAEASAKEEEQRRIREGVLTPKEQLEYSDKYNYSPTEVPGGFKLQSPTGEPGWYSSKPKEGEAAKVPLTQEQYAGLLSKNYTEVKPGTPGATEFSRRGPNGEVLRSVLMPPVDEQKQPKDPQFNAAGFSLRMKEAEGVFNQLGAAGYSRGGLKESAQSLLPEAFKPEQSKMQAQAERDFVNAQLRRESGANITKDEFASAERQYFPRAGDTPAVIEQKARNRATSLATMQSAAGPALSRVKAQADINSAGQRTPQAPRGKSSLIPNAMAGSAPPKAGQIEDGFLFKGGDAGNPKNWQRVKGK